VPCLEELFARSHRNLGVEAIDVLLLDGAELQLSFVGRAHFLERVLAAFRLFEEWRGKGADPSPLHSLHWRCVLPSC